MILTCDVIRREIEAGRVVIEPFFADQVGPASIDLHLGDEIRIMHAGREAVPMHRVGFPKDIQGLALFLASPASAYVTGQEIIIDGGWGLGQAD